MQNDNSIRITTDEALKIDAKSALSLPNIDAMISHVTDVSKETVKKELKKTLLNVFEILEEIPNSSKNFKIAEVDFTLSIDTAGEVSIVSVVKSSLSGQTGISFKIIRRERRK